MNQQEWLISKRFSYKNKNRGAEKLSELQTVTRNKIKDLLESSSWIEINRNCFICENDTQIKIAEIDRYLLPVVTVICKCCGFMFTNPVMREKDYEDFYINYYRELYTNSSQATESFFNQQYKTGKKIYKYLSRFTNLKGKSIVEIGTGAGGILKAFKDQGNTVNGCDYGDEYLNFGKVQGLDLIQGDISRIPDNSADIVIYCHVLEHIFNLEKEFENIKRILKPGGMVYVEVPGIHFIHYTYRGNFLKFLQNAHLYHFSKKTLSNLMQKNGFKSVAVNEKINGLFILEVTSTSKKINKSNYLITISYLKINEIFKFLLTLPWFFYDLLNKLR